MCRRVRAAEDETWDTVDAAEHIAPMFPDFQAQVTNLINELGGKVFPKLNWSAPRVGGAGRC